MTPSEVQALQALAERNGGTLTINPETGQPEASFLKKLLPMALGAFLGPAGAAIGGGFMSAGMAGLTVGGLTTLATGSLSRGLMAGMGAYGGAGLSSALMGAGTGAMTTAGVGDYATTLAARGLEAGTPEFAEAASQLALESQKKALAAPLTDKLSAGFKAVTDSPAAFGNFAKNNLSAGLAAVSPIMADEGVQTTTPRQDTGNIRRFSYDRFGQTFTPQGVFPAAGYVGMAQGGIVALAEGGAAEPLYKGLTSQSRPEDIAAAYQQFTSGRGGDTQANQAEALSFLGNLGIGQDRINTAYGMFQNPAANTGAAQTATTTAPAFDPKLGVFQNVYDPNTGREFISPLQAGQYGVKDYVTEMPMQLDFLNDTSKKAVTGAMAEGLTFDQALNQLGSQFGMSGKDFYNYEVQGGIRSRDTAPITQAIKTESGGLKPDELIARLQAYKDKPPTTAQEFRDQQALYADYANRYANSNYNYANMGGKAQDFSLKPQEYLKTQFTGYTEPVNQLLSSMNQNTPTFQKVREQLTGNPEIEKAFSDIYAINPKAPIFTGGANNLEATINNLAGNMSQIGKDAALKNFYRDQQNLIGFGSDNWFEGQNMGNPQWAELQRKIMSFTPIANDDKWNEMARRTSGNRNLEGVFRDPNTKLGVSLISNPETGYHEGIGYYDRNGQLLRTSLLRPEDILKNAEEFGFDTSATGALGKVLSKAKIDADPAEMATPEWLESQIKHLDGQARSAASFGMPYSDMDKEARIRDIRKTHEMAKRMSANRKQTNMAQGGLAALAKGGVSDQDVQNWFATNTGANDAQIAAAMQQFRVSPEQISRVTGVGMPEVQQRYETAIAPQIVGQYTGGIAGPGATTATPGTGYLGIYNQLQNAGVTAQELFNNPNYKGWSLPELEQAYNVAGKVLQFDPVTDSGTPTDKAWVDFMDANKFSVRNIAQATGLSEAEVQRRYNAVKAADKTVTSPIVIDTPRTITPPVITGNTQGPGTQGGIRDLTNVGPGTAPPGVSGNSGAGQFGGGTVVNPNGTITTSPRIPGIPVGGFTGMQNLRDAYTERGGSLGYVNPAPRTMEEFNQRFNKQTGDSLAAYNYLMGQGANPATQQRVGEIARPYGEAIVGLPVAEGRPNQRFIYQNGRYVENPNFVPVTYDSKGNRSTGMSSSEVLKGFQALPNKSDDAAIFDWVDANKISIAQLAAAMKISVAEAQRRMDAAAKKKTDAEAASTAIDPNAQGGANGGLMPKRMALGGLGSLAGGGQAGYNLGGYSDGGRLLRGPGDGVSDSIPATIGGRQPARLADGEFVIPARIVSELGNGSTEAGARKLYAMMDRVQKARGRTTGKRRVATNTRAEKYLPA
jgi:hypothetical protein